MSDIRRFIKGTESARPVAQKKEERVIDVPADIIAHPLPASLQTMVDAQSGTEQRALWLVPGVLSWGESPQERMDPCQWMSERHIRIVIDVSHEIRSEEFYAKNVERACAVFVHMPLNSKLKVPPGTVTDIIALSRVLQSIITESCELSPEERKISVHLCDDRGGSVAATIAAPLLALATGSSLVDSIVAMSRIWRHHMLRGQTVTGSVRVFPEGDWLKRATVAVHGRLRERPLAASSSVSLFEKIRSDAATLGLEKTAPTALRILDIDTRFVRSAAPFTRTEPRRVLSWLLADNKWKEIREFDGLDERINAHKRECDDKDDYEDSESRHRAKYRPDYDDDAYTF